MSIKEKQLNSTEIASHLNLQAFFDLHLNDKISRIIPYEITLTQNTTQPSGTHLEFVGEGKIITGAYTYTCNGTHNDSQNQIWDTSGGGSVVYSSKQPLVRPEWFGALGDNSNDDGPAINKAILAAGVIELGAKTYRCEERLAINKYKYFKGQGRNLTTINFALDPEIYDNAFVLTSAEYISGGGTDSTNATILEKFSMIGTTETEGLVLSEAGSPHSSTRLRIDNVGIVNFTVALRTKYDWACTFIDLELHGSDLGWYGHQDTNNISTVGMRFVNCKQFFYFERADGVTFHSALFQNLTDTNATAAAIAFRSTIEFTGGCYWENIGGADTQLLQLGASVDQVPCTIIMHGGIFPPNKSIIITESENLLDEIQPHYIEINGAKCNNDDLPPGIRCQAHTGHYVYVTQARITYSRAFTNSAEDAYVEGVLIKDHWWTGRERIGAATSQTLTPDKYSLINHGSLSTYSIFSVEDLTLGNRYTLVYQVRRNAGCAMSIYWRVGGPSGEIVSSGSLSKCIQKNTEEWETRYIPFEAQGDFMYVLAQNNYDVEFRFMLLYSGCVFPVISLDIERLEYAYSGLPAAGLWAKGRTIYQNNDDLEAGAHIGWKCVDDTVEGGTWLSIGQLPSS